MISRERVLIFLREKQESDGGYSGNDLTKLAELLMVTPFGLRRRLSFWIKTTKSSPNSYILGKKSLLSLFLNSSKLTMNLDRILLKLRKEYMGIFKKKENQEIKNH